MSALFGYDYKPWCISTTVIPNSITLCSSVMDIDNISVNEVKYLFSKANSISYLLH